MVKCYNCGKRIKKSEFYCPSCKEKELIKFKKKLEISKKRQLDSEVRKFNEYLKSGRRTY